MILPDIGQNAVQLWRESPSRIAAPRLSNSHQPAEPTNAGDQRQMSERQR